MKFIGKDNALLNILQKEHMIISSSIMRIEVFIQNFELTIDVDIRLMYSKDKYLKLRFIKIKEYSFYYNSDYRFYNIESYKLLVNNGFFYVSFDPENENSLSISENDQDSILCDSIEGYFIDPPIAY